MAGNLVFSDSVTVEAGAITLVAFQLGDDPGDGSPIVTPIVPGPPPVGPGDPPAAEATKIAPVVSLPSTGSGSSVSAMAFAVLIIAAALLAGSAAMTYRQRHR